MSITTIVFPIKFKDLAQRGYRTPFGRKMSALMDRLDFGASWDINPKTHIEVKAYEELTLEQRNLIIERVNAFLARQRSLGVIE